MAGPSRLRAAWIEARVQNYARDPFRSVETLARMVVELEDRHGVIPEFEMDEEWPERVRHLHPRRRA